MTDLIQVKVEFKKFIWTCPVCGLEDIVDASVGGGNEYEHTCKNGHKFNQSGSNMREYNGCLSYPYSEYPAVKSDDIEKEKSTRCDAWLYSVKNPPPYTPPTAEDIDRMIAEKQTEITSLETQKTEIVKG